jgi:dethiobiotin synthetase
MKAFITGTDTGVGKTFFTVLLTRALREAGLRTIALKPVCCGDREDAIALHEACDKDLGIEEINPIYLEAPVAPLIAARQAGTPVSVEQLKAWAVQVTDGRPSVLVEGAGGWLVPITENFSIADLAAHLGYPVLVVVANRLGCLNHTLLTLSDLRARGLSCLGLVLNSGLGSDESCLTNREILEELTGLPVLWEITKDQSSLSLTGLKFLP